MSSHVLVNRLGLTYKGAAGFSCATIPDVCKTPTPGGPVPIPYPNFARQSSLSGGTTTVFAKGNMIAIKGSQYGSSNGDEAGTAGGVKSNVNMKATDWITYSFDVKMDGKNVCRHTDKKFHNNQNAADLQGNQEPVPPPPPFVIDCIDAPAQTTVGKFTSCDKEEICGKIAALEDLRTQGLLVRTSEGAARPVYEAERALGDSICDTINNHARNGRGPDGSGRPEDLGFHDMSDECLSFKQQEAADNDYVGFSPDHVHEIQLGGHPTDFSNLRWMSSRPNSWMGTTMTQYDPAQNQPITGNCC